MKEITTNKELVSFCGLYCGSCSKYLKEKCPGCAGNENAKWCKIRLCNIEHGYKSCADCKEFEDVTECKKFNNFVSKAFEFVFRSSRKSGIQLIKEKGYENFAEFMADNELVTIKRGMKLN